MKEFSDHIFHYRGFQRLQELINYCLCTRRWCAIMKENELFSFIWTGPAALIAPGDILVGFRPISRTISEPPSHRECATFAALACPFLTQREAARRTAGLPDPTQLTQAAGFGLARQPGVVCLWTARSCRPFRVSDRAIAAGAQPGVLFELGEPTDIRWYREARPATPAEIYASVASGLPALRDLARQEGTGAVLHLERQIDRFLALVPGLRDCERDPEEGC
jgi:hypothetical protein